MSVTNITNENFNQEVLKEEKPVIVDFWAEWCGPCKMLTPTLHEFAEESDDVKVCKVNVDEQPELAKQFRVMSIPTLLVFKGGEVVNRSVGAKSKQEIRTLI